jgi:hypothetical protein
LFKTKHTRRGIGGSYFRFLKKRNPGAALILTEYPPHPGLAEYGEMILPREGNFNADRSSFKVRVKPDEHSGQMPGCIYFEGGLYVKKESALQ